MMNKNISIGIIGGSGLYEMQGLKDVKHVSLDTPFGAPSDAYVIGTLEGVRVAFLPRHGKGHRLSPSELNFRANIYGFKKLGVEHLISVTAVGSLKESIRPLDIVIPDQFYDCTKARVSTFFGNGLVAHIAFADPVCPDLAKLIFKGGTQVGTSIHSGGTLLCIEGPAFSTRASSEASSGSPGATIAQPSINICAPICSATTLLFRAIDPLSGAWMPFLRRK